MAGKLLASTQRLTRHNYTLFRRDWCTCAYCGMLFREGELKREHAVPTGCGGTDTWTNLVSAYRSCNQLKAAKTPDEARMPLSYLPSPVGGHDPASAARTSLPIRWTFRARTAAWVAVFGLAISESTRASEASGVAIASADVEARDRSNSQ